MPKLMPSLRHTKSEEHLESTNNATRVAATLSNDASGGGGGTTVDGAAAVNGVKILIDKVPENSLVGSSPSAMELSAVHIRDWNENGMTEDDVWSQEDDEITAQYMKLHKICERDAISQMSLDSIDSREQSKCDARLC